MSEPIQLFDESFNALEQAMERSVRWQEVIAHNIANADTPGYVPLTFNEELQKAVRKADKKMVLEDELAALGKNSIEYSSYIKIITNKLGILRTIVTQGRK